jgi:hypothetical protein
LAFAKLALCTNKQKTEIKRRQYVVVQHVACVLYKATQRLGQAIAESPSFLTTGFMQTSGRTGDCLSFLGNVRSVVR